MFAVLLHATFFMHCAQNWCLHLGKKCSFGDADSTTTELQDASVIVSQVQAILVHCIQLVASLLCTDVFLLAGKDDLPTMLGKMYSTKILCRLLLFSIQPGTVNPQRAEGFAALCNAPCVFGFVDCALFLSAIHPNALVTGGSCMLIIVVPLLSLQNWCRFKVFLDKELENRTRDPFRVRRIPLQPLSACECSVVLYSVLISDYLHTCEKPTSHCANSFSLRDLKIELAVLDPHQVQVHRWKKLEALNCRCQSSQRINVHKGSSVALVWKGLKSVDGIARIESLTFI